MAKVLASQTRGAIVITDKGLKIGRLQDMLIDEKSGHIKMLVVSVTIKGLLENLPKDESGNQLIPYNLVATINDNIVVNEEGVLKCQATNSSFK